MNRDEIKQPDGEAQPKCVRPSGNEEVVLGGQKDEGKYQNPDVVFFSHGLHGLHGLHGFHRLLFSVVLL